MDIFDNPGYRANKYRLTIVGLWPYQPTPHRRILCVLIYFSITTVILVQGLKLIQLWGNIDMMVECVVPMGVQVVAMLKSSNCVSNENKMKRISDLIRRDWARVTNKEEMSILMRYVEQGRLLGLLYVSAVLGSMTIYLIVPLLPQILDVVQPRNETRPRQFLYNVDYYFMDAEDHYTFVMFHNYVGTILTVFMIVSVDAMLVAYVHHACGMFTIIGNRLERTMRNADDVADINDRGNKNEIHVHVADCIRHHGEVIELARLIEMSVSISLFFQIAVSMLMISATGLQLVVKLGEKHDEVFRLGQFIVGQLIHLFVNSWPSQMLMDHSQQFRESVYFADWYRFPLRERHLIRLVMLRSLKPCKISAGKLYDMSMESFGKVVQTSLSYFTVLVSLR